MKQYSNQLLPLQLTGMNEETCKIIADQEEFNLLHPFIDNYRLTIEGCFTCDVGELITGSSSLLINDEGRKTA